MSDDKRAIELEVEVEGTPEQVWQAIATGPGISSWFVPHTVEERAGGATTSSFGPGPEMQVAGRVVTWDPPHRVVFDGGEEAPGLAFEWLVEARDGGGCVVRLVNTGFGDGGPWDDQYDQMTEGWKVFMRNLQLHLAHFRGQTATASLPMAMWAGSREQVWDRLTNDLGIAAKPEVGERVTVTADDTPALTGTVTDSEVGKLIMLVEVPAPGTAFLLVEGADGCGVSVWSYLYGPDGAAAAEQDGPRWTAWLAERA